jgi:hypothetical protein
MCFSLLIAIQPFMADLSQFRPCSLKNVSQAMGMGMGGEKMPSHAPIGGITGWRDELISHPNWE